MSLKDSRRRSLECMMSLQWFPNDCRASKQARPFLMIRFLSEVDISYPYSDQSSDCHTFCQIGKLYDLEEIIADQQWTKGVLHYVRDTCACFAQQSRTTVWRPGLLNCFMFFCFLWPSFSYFCRWNVLLFLRVFGIACCDLAFWFGLTVLFGLISH
jgi:hypothetical protein